MSIEEIVRKVLLELEKQGASMAPVVEKPRLLALKVPKDATERVEEVFGATYDISWKDRWEEQACYDRILLGTTEVNTLYDLAHGRNPAEGALMDYVMMGLVVEVLEEGLVHRRCAATSPPALAKLHEGYVRRMKELGIGLCALQHPSAKGRKAETASRRRLIREADVNAVAAQGARTLEIPAGSIITPLAADAIRNHNIEVLRT